MRGRLRGSWRGSWRGGDRSRGRGGGWRGASAWRGRSQNIRAGALVRATHPAAGDVSSAYFVRRSNSLRRVVDAPGAASPPPTGTPEGYVRAGRSLRRVAEAPPGTDIVAVEGGAVAAAATAEPAAPKKLPPAPSPPSLPPGYLHEGRSLRRRIVVEEENAAPPKRESSQAVPARSADEEEQRHGVDVDGPPASESLERLKKTPVQYVRAGNSLRRVGEEPEEIQSVGTPEGFTRAGNSLRRAALAPVRRRTGLRGGVLKPGGNPRDGASKKLVRSATGAFVVKGGRSLKRLPSTEGLSSRNRRLDRRKLEHCLFFAKYGRCDKAESATGCAFIHDPTAIGVCRAWLVGRCPHSSANCSLSHAVDREKMPACELFLDGRCPRGGGACPYLHVLHAEGTPLCEPFALRGFCAKGQACDEVHTWNCLEFVRTGECKVDNCRLRHWSQRRRERAQSDLPSGEAEEAVDFVEEGSMEVDDAEAGDVIEATKEDECVDVADSENGSGADSGTDSEAVAIDGEVPTASAAQRRAPKRFGGMEGDFIRL